MKTMISYAAMAAALAIAGPSLAQSSKPPAPQSGAPASAPATTSATQPSSAAPASAAPSTTNPAPAAPAAAPSATTPAAPAGAAATGSTSDTAANAGAPTTLTSGMSVKDNTGALIGEVKSVKGSVATISMGSDTFTVDSDKLGVAGGAATINATQAELKKMLPPKK